MTNDSSNYWLYGVDLQKGTFHKFDLQIDDFDSNYAAGHAMVQDMKSRKYTAYRYDDGRLEACDMQPLDDYDWQTSDSRHTST
jgi:hypothetical protein